MSEADPSTRPLAATLSFHETVQRRTSVRAFRPDPVPRERRLWPALSWDSPAVTRQLLVEADRRLRGWFERDNFGPTLSHAWLRASLSRQA